ncbi:ATP-dependent DNA helicase [Candidatus Woesearchaeota archaeon]|nr:ATP-dependent DNA helicase [Candidatus Woesearchaeota archaeon]
MQIFFPHEKIRESQDILIEKIQEAIKNKTNLLAHAPTGLGKSAASLSAALSYAIENKKTIFFITPKHTQHRIAIETLRLIKQKYNLDFSVIDLIGKKWMCAQEGASEMPSGEFYDYCKDMIKSGKCSYYNNIKRKDKLTIETQAAISELSKKILHVEEFKDYSKARILCPFEVACLVAKKSTVIIADYHHIISQSIRENLLERINKSLNDCIIIIDEAHNLPQRCRELLSNQLSTPTIDFSIKESEALGHKEIALTISEIKKSLENLANKKINKFTNEALITKQELIKEIEKIIDVDQISSDLNFIGEKIIEEKKRSASKVLANFLINWQGPDESFTRIIKKSKNQKGKEIISLTYKCLDPSLITRPLAEMSHSLICMSGTLTPIDMYKDLLGFNTLTQEFINPFPEENKLTIIIPETTTKYTARSNEMFEQIATHCSSIINITPGNSIIFFPSYQLRDEINKFLQNKCEKTIFSEQPNMTKQEKNELLERFKSYKKTGAVLLGASSGNFGEGIDIEDNILKCVIVVGIPLDKPDLETQQLIEYYNKKFNKGWDYGYIMPAIIKCLQNAGRCIRSEKDKGLIVYLDQRYIWDSYFKCFPKDNTLRITKTPLVRIKEFFDQS